MYKIIGANQMEYGPVTSEQLRQWIAEGRVNAQTLAQAQGETTWKPISSFPEFAAGFAPAPAAAPPLLGASVAVTGTRASALEKVYGPAIGLMITAILGFAGALVGLLWSVAGVGAMNWQSLNLPGQNPEMMRMLQMTTGAVGTVFRLIGLAVCVLIFYGGLKMKKLENHGLCVGAGVVALIPCVSPCCLVGLPVGIWALVVLNNPEVRAHFT
jgi:hypothetical protein